MSETMRDKLKELVAIPSVSGNESEIADYLFANIDQRPNCEVTRLDDDIVVRVSGEERERAFIMNGHTDTVSAQIANGLSPYELRTDPENDDRLIGLGTSDMKAGLAIMLDFIENARDTKPPCDLIFLFSTNEETTGAGSENIMKWLNESSYLKQYENVGGLILEPTDAEFVGIGHRGDTLWKAQADGPGGHASQTFDTYPAIEKMGQFIAGLSTIRKEWAANYTDTALGVPSINVTSLKAEGETNVVPGNIEAVFNLRVTPQLLTHLEETRARLADTYGLTIAQSWQPSPSVSDPDTQIYRTMQSVAPNLPFRAFPGATDKYIFDEHDIPMLIYGPGSVAAMHQPHESVLYSKMVTCRSVIEHAIKYYAFQ